MKRILLFAMLFLMTGVVTAQSIVKGDMNGDGVIDIVDVTALVNVAVGRAAVEYIDVYAVDNTAVIGTWYKSDGSSFAFRQDGTTSYPGGATYEYRYLLRELVVYSSSGSVVKTMQLREVKPQYLLEESSVNGSTTRYINSAYLVTGITLSPTSLALNSGATGQLTATVSPSTALEKGVVWSSSDDTVTTVDQNGLVTAVAVGMCTITCAATDGSAVSGTCSVRVPYIIDGHEVVNLGLPSGTLWATCNVGADNPEDYGDYFAWGETTGYTQDTSDGHSFDWSTYKYAIDNATTLTKYCSHSNYGYNGFTDSKTELDLSDDAAYVNWGSNWRMPSEDQKDELLNECTWTWTTRNGKSGCEVRGPNGNTLFLPAAGYRWKSSIDDVGVYGNYWLRTLYTSYPYRAYYLLFFSDTDYVWNDSYDDRSLGASVRPVRVSQ